MILGFFLKYYAMRGADIINFNGIAYAKVDIIALQKILMEKIIGLNA